MRDVLPFAALALLLAANKQSPSRKPPIKVIYNCFKGCNWSVGGDCWSRDYDWTVTAYVPIIRDFLFTTEEQALQYMEQLRNTDAPIYNKVEIWTDLKRMNDYPNLDGRELFVFQGLHYVSFASARSQAWDYNNPQSFYAEQAEKVVSAAYDNAKGYIGSMTRAEVLPIQDYSVDVSYTKEFDDCAEKDMQLDMLVGFIKQYLTDYLVKQFIPV